MEKDTYTLTSAIGKFIFPNEVQLSHAKLVRDTVVGQWLNPKQREMDLTSEDEVYEFMRNHSSNVIVAVPFELQLKDELERKAMEAKVWKRVVGETTLTAVELQGALRLLQDEAVKTTEVLNSWLTPA